MINCEQALIIVVIVLIISLIKSTIAYPLYEFHQQAHMIPHPQKAHRGGEDAFYSNCQLMIVADGVGGWNQHGIDPAKYSRFLCSKGSQLFAKNQSFYRQNPVQIIAQASRLNNHVGSSTMVVVTLSNQTLRTCYIGDSGFLILRKVGQKFQIIHEYKEQQHRFNFPFQLAREQFHGDDPYLSICQNFKIQQNDIIVVGSDGLFDNIYVEEILELINQSQHDQRKLFNLKQGLAKLAIQRGHSTSFWSPFAKRAKQQNLQYQGGKLDDTTVIISKIRKISNKSEQIIKVDEQKFQNKTHEQIQL